MFRLAVGRKATQRANLAMYRRELTQEKNGNHFNPFAKTQLKSHCGPCSLMYCIYKLRGTSLTQRQLAAKVSTPVWPEGMNERQLKTAARAYGVKSRYLAAYERNKGRTFVRRLKSHLRNGNPAVLLVEDFSHWVAVLGMLEGRFVINDPVHSKNMFGLWSERTLTSQAWNQDKRDAEFFAILLRRGDRKPAVWQISKEWLSLCRRGSEDEEREMAKALTKLAAYATRGRLRRRPSNPDFLADKMERLEDVVMDSVHQWVGDEEYETSGRDVRNLYRDYTIIARAYGILVPVSINTTKLVAQLTALMTKFKINGTV